jgi:hypothetical protein
MNQNGSSFFIKEKSIIFVLHVILIREPITKKTLPNEIDDWTFHFLHHNIKFIKIFSEETSIKVKVKLEV